MKFFNLEEFEKKYSYKVSKEVDEKFKESIELGVENSYIKQEKEDKVHKEPALLDGVSENNKNEQIEILNYANGDIYEGQLKNGKNKEKEFTNTQMGMFMKANFKMIYLKEK